MYLNDFDKEAICKECENANSSNNREFKQSMDNLRKSWRITLLDIIRILIETWAKERDRNESKL